MNTNASKNSTNARRPAAKTLAAPAASRPTGAKASKMANGKTTQKTAAPQKTPAKRRSLPLIEIIVLILLLKIGAGAYYVLKSPTESVENATAAVSAIKNLPDKVFALVGLGAAPSGDPEASKTPAATMSDYIAAAADAVSPAAAHAVPVQAAAVSQNAIAAGAFMVLGSQAASGDVARTGTPSIPLPPGSDDLLIPAAQLPPPPLPSVGNNQPAGGQGSAGLSGENVPSPAGLRSREQELAQKEAVLSSKEEALTTLEGELNRRLSAMETSRSEIESMTQRNEEILAEQKALREQQQQEDQTQRDARIEHLVIAYKGMKAEQAGALINSMEDDVAVAILSAMPGRNAGLILANVNPEKAARLTKAISERRIDPNLLTADAPAEGMQAQP